MTKREPRIAFIHPEVVKHRVPVFDMLYRKYKPKIFLTYPKSRVKEYMESRDWDYEIVYSIHIPGYRREAPLGLIPKLLFGGFDVILCTDVTTFESQISFLIAKALGKKFVLWDELWVYPRTWRYRLARPYLEYVVRHADACIAASTKTREFHLKSGASHKKTFLAPLSSVDYSDRKVGGLRRKLGLSGKKVVLYLSRIVEYKGLDVLVKAFARLEEDLSDVFLVVGGEGPFKPAVDKIVSELKVENIMFAGFIGEDDLPSYYRLCDVFVLPTKFLFESDVPAEAWGCVLNEVMSCGKPVIATDAVAAAYDLIKNGVNGFMVKENNVEELYESLKKIVSDDELAEKMGGESRRIIDGGFTFTHTFRGVSEAVDFVLSGD